MSQHDVNADRLLYLAEIVCDDIASDEEFAELDAILLADDAHRRCYLDYHRMRVELRMELRAQQAAQKMRERIDVDLAFPHPNEYIVAASQTPSTMPLSFLGSAIHGAVGYLPESLPFAYLVATVICGVGLLIGSLVHMSPPLQVVRQSVSPLAPLPAIVGRITGMLDCQWEGRRKDEGGRMKDELPTAGNGIHPSSFIPHPSSSQSLVSLGDKFALSSGLMEITYDSGAKVILQGPVAYEVESASGGYLSVGKLTASIEKKEERGTRNEELSASRSSFLIPHSYFSVRTPTASVTDLGTEFGVEVGDGTTEAHVFVGKVAMTSTTGDNQQTTEQILCAGNAARVDNKGDIVATTALSEGRFVRVLPHPTPTSRSEAYATTVLSMKPVVYYRMEQPKDEKDRFTLFDSAPGGHHGKVHCVNEYAQSWLRGRFGDSLCLHGQYEPEYAIVQDYPKAEDGRLSVSAWVFCESQTKFNTIVGNWGGETCGQFALSLCQDNVNDGRDNGLYAVVAQPDNQLLYVREGGSKPFPIAQWQHVAFVFDKTTLRLYRNGIEVASGKCNGLLTKVEMPRLNIGCDVTDDGSAQWNFWRGQIDELAIFNRALTLKEIQRLHKPQAKEPTTIEK